MLLKIRSQGYVAGRFNPGDVDSLQFVDIVQYAPELAGKCVDFVLVEMQLGQCRNLENIIPCDCHSSLPPVFYSWYLGVSRENPPSDPSESEQGRPQVAPLQGLGAD